MVEIFKTLTATGHPVATSCPAWYRVNQHPTCFLDRPTPVHRLRSGTDLLSRMTHRYPITYRGLKSLPSASIHLDK